MKMEEERFRVSVCLQHYYSDRRSRAYMSIVAKNKVQWLQLRVRTLFALEGQFFLRSRGHLLHPDEPLSLLRPDDPVEVVPLPEEVSRVVERVTDNKKLNGIDYSGTQGNLPKWEEEGSEDKLLEMKQRALLLLDQFSGENEHYVDEPDGSWMPRGRRRVRRRKHRTHMPSGQPGSGSSGSRKPRLVRSLSPP